MRTKEQIQDEMRRLLIDITDEQIIQDVNRISDYFEYGKVIAIWEVNECVSHRVFYVETEIDSIIIKQLSPKMLSRPSELTYHICSQEIAYIALNAGIPTIVAKIGTNGSTIKKVGANYYMVYQYSSEAIKHPCDINENDCFIIGSYLARIHSLDFSMLSGNDRNLRVMTYTRINTSEIKSYFSLRIPNRSRLFKGIMALLIQEVSRKCDRYIKHDVISHCDLTPNNVIWSDKSLPKIIDWDAAGYTNLYKDIVQTIFSWCYTTVGCNWCCLNSFLDGYLSVMPLKQSLPWRACVAALCEDVESICYEHTPERIETLISALIQKWRNIRETRKIFRSAIKKRAKCR